MKFGLAFAASLSGTGAEALELCRRAESAGFESVWGGEHVVLPSRIESIGRSHALHRTIAAYAGTACIGYAVVFPETRDLAQIAVDPTARHRGIASQLLRAALDAIEPGGPLRILNVDAAAEGELQFFRGSGARDLVSQYEMTLDLRPDANLV